MHNSKKNNSEKALLDPKTIKGEQHAHLRALSSMALGAVTAMTAAVPVFADDVWTNFSDGILGVIDGIKPFVTALAIIALVVGGLGCIIGGEQSREKFKHALPWIVGGSAIALLAPSLAEKIITASVNSGGNGYYSSKGKASAKAVMQLNSFLAAVNLPIIN